VWLKGLLLEFGSIIVNAQFNYIDLVHGVRHDFVMLIHCFNDKHEHQQSIFLDFNIPRVVASV